MTSGATNFPTIEGGAGRPPEPNWTKIFKTVADRESASALWRGVITEMQAAGTLAMINAPMVARYVIFQVEFERQARALGKTGVVRKAPKTKVPMIHPGWSVMKQAAEAAAALEAELAISPRRRNSGGKVSRTERKKTRAADAFLKQVT